MAVLESWVQGDLQPDITLYLDVAPDIAEQRIATREKDRMEVERRDFFLRVRQGYLDRAKEHARFEIIDAGNPLLLWKCSSHQTSPKHPTHAPLRSRHMEIYLSGRELRIYMS